MKLKVTACLIVLMVIFLCHTSFSSYRPSPLAKLMKRMQIFLVKEKSRIEADKPPLKFPADSAKMLRASITPGKHLPVEHSQYAAEFFRHLNNYYKDENKHQRKLLFNNLVQSCVSCHQHECPGPISAIKKNMFTMPK